MTQQADLSVTKTAPATAMAGGDITYALVVGNDGPSDASVATVVDVLPAGTTFVSAAQESGPAATIVTPPVGSGGTVIITATSLAVGTTLSFTLVLNIDAALPTGATLTNGATVSSSAADPNLENDAASALTAIEVAQPPSTTVATSTTTTPATSTTATPTYSPFSIEALSLAFDAVTV